MKAFHIALGIAGFTVLLGGAAALRSKLKYKADGQEIQRLIGEYRAMGVATNGTEFFHKIPDSENAWIDLEPLLTQKKGDTNYALLRGFLSSDFISYSERRDGPAIKKYLAPNIDRLTKLMAVLDVKPKFQIPRDYDRGFDFFVSMNQLREFGLEMCDWSIANALDGDYESMDRHLSVVSDVANRCYRLETIDGIQIANNQRQLVLNTMARILEFAPNAYEPLHRLSVRQKYIDIDYPRVFEAGLLEQIATIRFYDSPQMDHTEPIFPLNLLPKPKDVGKPADADSAGTIKKGDYIPQSPAGRSFLLERLRRWKPIISHLAAGGHSNLCPAAKELAAIYDEPYPDKTGRAIDEYRSIGLAGFEPDHLYRILTRNKMLEQATAIFWKAMEIHHKTGKFPTSMAQIGLPTSAFACTKGLEYTYSDNGFALRSGLKSDSGVPYFKTSFPLSMSFVPYSGKPPRRQRIDDFMSGKISREGQETKGTGGPPGPGMSPQGND